MLRLIVLALLASFLLLGPAAASGVEPENCPYGAISALGPVDAEGRGDTEADVACVEP